MSQALIAILQHVRSIDASLLLSSWIIDMLKFTCSLLFSRLYKIQGGVVCRVYILSMVVIKEARNLLLLWVCRHEKRMLPLLSYIVLWHLWRQQHTLISKHECYTLGQNGTHGIGYTMQDLLISEPYRKQQQHMLDGLEIRCLFEARMIVLKDASR